MFCQIASSELTGDGHNPVNYTTKCSGGEESLLDCFTSINATGNPCTSIVVLECLIGKYKS